MLAIAYCGRSSVVIRPNLGQVTSPMPSGSEDAGSEAMVGGAVAPLLALRRAPRNLCLSLSDQLATVVVRLQNAERVTAARLEV